MRLLNARSKGCNYATSRPEQMTVNGTQEVLECCWVCQARKAGVGCFNMHVYINEDLVLLVVLSGG